MGANGFRKINNRGLFPIYLFVFISVLGLSSCGGGSSKCDAGDIACNPGQSTVPSGNGPSPIPSGGGSPIPGGGGSPIPGGGGGGGSVGGGFPTPPNGYLDCANLDPSKVYLLGTIQEGSSETYVLADAEDPRVFCLGFPSGSSRVVVTPQGNFIYSNSSNYYTMVHEPFGLSPTDSTVRVYPTNVQSNDILISPPVANCGRLMFNPSNSDMYFQCSDGIHTETVSPYYLLDYSVGTLLAVASDGSLLIEDGGNLIHVDPSLNETVLTLPGGSPSAYTFYTARVHTDSVTNNESVWLLVRSSGEFERWNIDLTTFLVSEDGEYSSVPSGYRESFSRVLDGDGNLWQTGDDFPLSGTGNDVILKRPILSSSLPSEVIYNEADANVESWTTVNIPYAKLHGSHLVTGL